MVSAGVPVYDRMYSPPIFRGVVTIDMRSCDMCPLHTTQPVPISIAGGCGIHSRNFRILAEPLYNLLLAPREKLVISCTEKVPRCRFAQHTVSELMLDLMERNLHSCPEFNMTKTHLRKSSKTP